MSSKAGRNTPQSVLSYIDAIWTQNEPPDSLELASELGYTPKQFRRLKEKHGDGLVRYLLTVRRARTETPRFPAAQNGLLHPPQYVSSSHGAIDDQAVDELTQWRITEDARRNAQERQVGESGELLAAMNDLRSAIDTMPEDRKRRISRTLWQLRSRLDSAERELRRRLAA